jgi:hypothetical protein
MTTMDIFNQDAFTMVSLTGAISRTPYQPQRLGQMNLFMPMPVRTVTVAVEAVDGKLSVIQTSQRGAPLAQRTTEKRTIRDFRTARIAKGDRIMADEIQGIRAFGSETEVMQVQAEVARRLDGPVGIRRDVELTWENMRLGAIQGVVLDADGSTIYDWFAEWGISAPAEIDFDLDNASPASGALRKKCTQVIRAVQRGAKGAFTQGSRVHAMVGDNFWDDLVAHPEVRATLLATPAAMKLSEDVTWQLLDFGGIVWENYRGTDDASTVAIGTDKAKFFPENAPGVFGHVMSPAETFDYVNTPGLAEYAMIVPDRDRNSFVDVEVYSYPLFICMRPETLQSARRT